MFYLLPPSKFATMDLGPRGPCLDQALGFGTKTQFGWCGLDILKTKKEVQPLRRI